MCHKYTFGMKSKQTWSASFASMWVLEIVIIGREWPKQLTYPTKLSVINLSCYVMFCSRDLQTFLWKVDNCLQVPPEGAQIAEEPGELGTESATTAGQQPASREQGGGDDGIVCSECTHGSTAHHWELQGRREDVSCLVDLYRGWQLQIYLNHTCDIIWQCLITQQLILFENRSSVFNDHCPNA